MEDHEQNPQLQERIERFENEARKLGCYLQTSYLTHSLPGLQLDQQEDEGDDPQMLLAVILVGEEAFSDRVLNPDKHHEDTQFRTLTADSDPLDTLRDQIRQQLESGEDPWQL